MWTTRVSGVLDREGQRLALDERRVGGPQPLEHRLDTDRLQVHGDLTGVQAGQVQELVQERFERIDARQDAIDASLCVRLGGGVAERGAEEPERVERLPQIVAGRREEARLRQARLLGPLALGLRLLLLHLEGLDQGEVFQAEPDAAADRPALQTGKGHQEGEVEDRAWRRGAGTDLHRAGPGGGLRVPASRTGSRRPPAGDSPGWRRCRSERVRRPPGTRRRRAGSPRPGRGSTPGPSRPRAPGPSRCSGGPTPLLVVHAADPRREPGAAASGSRPRPASARARPG